MTDAFVSDADLLIDLTSIFLENNDVMSSIGKKTLCKMLPSFSAFPTVFPKAFLNRVIKSLDWVLKG